MRVLSKAVAWPQQRGWEEEGEEGEGTNPHHSPPAITSPHHHHPRSTLPFLNFFVFLFRARATRRSPPNCIFNLFDEPRKTVCCSVFSFFFFFSPSLRESSPLLPALLHLCSAPSTACSLTFRLTFICNNFKTHWQQNIQTDVADEIFIPQIVTWIPHLPCELSQRVYY